MLLAHPSQMQVMNAFWKHCFADTRWVSLLKSIKDPTQELVQGAIQAQAQWYSQHVDAKLDPRWFVPAVNVVDVVAAAGGDAAAAVAADASTAESIAAVADATAAGADPTPTPQVSEHRFLCVFTLFFPRRGLSLQRLTQRDERGKRKEE